MELVKWNRIKSEIAQCQDIIQLSKLKYTLEAVQDWAKQSKQSLETQNEIAEYRLRLDRKRGQWVEENIPPEGGESGGRPTKNPAENGQVIPTLSEAGIGHHESPKLRDIASIPEEDFEEHIAITKDKGEELTSIATQRLAKRLKQTEQTEIKSPPLPDEKYQTLVIDPPWPSQKILREVRPNQDIFDYPTMTIEQIKQFPLNQIAAENSHIYLWTTHKFLPDALDILEFWDFKYQCLLTWVKNVGMTPFSWMYSTEHCLFGRKGNLDLLKKGIRLDFTGKVREHSRKPDEFYSKVKLVSPEPRIDIFSREKREGFEQYGNEKDKFSN